MARKKIARRKTTTKKLASKEVAKKKTAKKKRTRSAPSSKSYEVLPAGKMREKYGLIAENRVTITLKPSNVPQVPRKLIPLAEQFGVGDDLIREDVVANTDRAALEAMRAAVVAQAQAFDDWLAGPESGGPGWSDEYMAFTCLRMASEEF